MTINKFYEWLEQQPICDKLVSMRFKYRWEQGWCYSNEYLEVDMDYPTLYIWLNDWNEGQQDIEVLGCVDVGDIVVPNFDKQMESEE